MPQSSVEECLIPTQAGTQSDFCVSRVWRMGAGSNEAQCPLPCLVVMGYGTVHPTGREALGAGGRPPHAGVRKS